MGTSSPERDQGCGSTTSGTLNNASDLLLPSMDYSLRHHRLPSPSRVHGSTCRGLRTKTRICWIRALDGARGILTWVCWLLSRAWEIVLASDRPGPIARLFRAARARRTRALVGEDNTNSNYGGSNGNKHSCSVSPRERLMLTLEAGWECAAQPSATSCKSESSAWGAERWRTGVRPSSLTLDQPLTLDMFDADDHDPSTRHTRHLTDVSPTVTPLPSPSPPRRRLAMAPAPPLRPSTLSATTPRNPAGAALGLGGGRIMLWGTGSQQCNLCGYTLEEGQEVVMAPECADSVKVSLPIRVRILPFFAID